MSSGHRRPLFTVGHSNHSIGHFLGLLRRHAIEAVADVRSRPYSRFVPHFGKERLAHELEAVGLGYLFLGRELGGKPPRGARTAPPMTYRMRLEQPEFREGIDRLLRAAETGRVAVMCRERDPLECHRFHLICRYLRPLGLDVRHILSNGETEGHQAIERRLLAQAGTPDLPLFQGRVEPASEQDLMRAYDRWWRSPGA